MIKSERFRDNDQLKQIASIGLVPSFSVRPSISQPPPPPIVIPQRSLDPHAIDISSIKGQFAWEKIPHGDTYVPVIFRDTKKYFCVNMLHKVLPEYPEDILRRSLNYQYRKSIDLFTATPSEVELLNRINVRHAHWAYSRHPFNSETELVSAADFLPFYEHLQLFLKSSSIPRASSVGSSKQILPQAQKSSQNSADFAVNMRNANRRNSSIAIPMRQQTVNDLSRNNSYSVAQSNVQSSLNFLPPTTSNYNIPPIEFARQALQQELSSVPSRQPIATTSTTPSLINGSESPISSAAASSTTRTNSRKSSVESLEQQRLPVRKQSISMNSTSKSSHPYNGWLQINKLYTPFISTDPSNHQLYRIPVSLLSFYDLLKYPSSDNQMTDMEQTLVTSHEIKLINELCLKQNIKPFAIDTKLISLATFYRYYSANALFIKELPLNNPKSMICKDWSSIVQMHGGIYRLRNITTLQEQTVPFIGKNLVKIFQLSPQCLSSALITTPTSSELEFIQLILFFCNIPINLHHVKLIDIETVQKEYTVDLILLYNDKFPSNVLSYQQQQSSRSSSSQEHINQSQTSAAANTFAESTPPPSPRSSPTNHIQSQIPLNSSLMPSSSSSSSTASPNRFQKMITFRGHELTAYICSGLESTNQRECVSVRDLCNILYPNSLIADKLETKLLRLLRTKNINRFRPQSQQALSFTRLVDIQDINTHWNFILQEMGLSSSSSSPSSSNASDVDNNQNISLPMASTTTTTTTTMDNDKSASPRTSVLIEKPIESDKNGKRSSERDMETDNTSTMVQVDKRTRLSSENQVEQPTVDKTIIVEFNDNDGHDVQIREMDTSDDNSSSSRSLSTELPKKPVAMNGSVPKRNNTKPKKRLIQRKNKPMSTKPMVSSQNTTNIPAKKKIRLVRKRPTPRLRSSEQKQLAAWVKKYNIEECFVHLDCCDTIYDVRRI